MRKIEIILTGEIQDDVCVGFESHKVTMKSLVDTYNDVYGLKIVAIRETEE